MKTITEKASNSLQLNWQELRQEAIISSFEIFHSDEGEYNRITARDFGQVSQDFFEALKSINPEANTDGLALNIGVEENSQKAEMFWEFTKGKQKTFIIGESNKFQTFLDQNYNPLKPRMGVSPNYKNEVCSNWANIPYFEMNAIFFAMLDLKNKQEHGEALFLKRPRRVLKFVIPKNDLEVLKEVVTVDKNIIIHYGVNYGDAARQTIPFIPVIQVYTPNLQGSFEEDDPESTYLDFVGACPPWCAGGGNG